MAVPTVEMDTVLELLEKTVLLFGQCNNTITYEIKKMFLFAVTGTSSSQVASVLKEKVAFLQKHDQALFGKDFRSHLTKSLKAKKQSIEAIAEVSKSTNRKRPFERSPYFTKEDQMEGGQKGRSEYNGKYILFQKRGILSQQQSNFTSSYDKHGVINSCLSNSENFFSKQKIPKSALAGRINEFLPARKLLTKDQGLLVLVEGYKIPLLMEPVQEKAPKVPKLN